MEGNETIAEAAIIAGCRYYFGYPITPQNEIGNYMAFRLPQVNGTFIQAESEIAAINMLFGAAVAGAKAMTSSSSPGISLKQEGISYMAGCELPGIIVNIVRGGPGLGNIASAQSDYFQATRGGGHGDYRTIVLAPAYLQELMDLGILAFDLTFKYRNPVIILADGLLAQMKEPVVIREYKEHKDDIKKDWILDGAKNRPPRSIKSLKLTPEEALEQHNLHLLKKYEEITKNEIKVEIEEVDTAEIIIIAYGTSARISKAVIKQAKKKGIKVGLIRPITLWPFPEEIIAKTAQRVKAILVVEMSLGQLIDDVKIAVAGKTDIFFYGRTGGIIPTPEEIYQQILKIEKLKNG